MSEQQYISIKRAAEQLGISRPALYHYVKGWNLEVKRFEYDRQSYLKMADFERIQKTREEIAERNG